MDLWADVGALLSLVKWDTVTGKQVRLLESTRKTPLLSLATLQLHLALCIAIPASVPDVVLDS